LAAGLAAEAREQHLADLRERESSAARTETLLLVDVGDSRQFALPTSMISRLERAARSSIEWADGREVIQYRGAILPLVRLSEILGTGEAGEADQREFQIVVYSDRGVQCGFLVNRIVDIVETELRDGEFRRGESSEGESSDGESSDGKSHLLGTSIIQQRVTDVLNLSCLARRRATTTHLEVRGA
jgi:two-component system chemotaxis sensor kinase CheA